MAYMSHTIRISDETYEFIAIEAARNRVAPEVWLEKKLQSGRKSKISEKARSRAWKNYIGAFDSSRSGGMSGIDEGLPTSKRLDKLLGHVLEEKGRKQGLKLDE